MFCERSQSPFASLKIIQKVLAFLKQVCYNIKVACKNDNLINLEKSPSPAEGARLEIV